MRCGGAQVKARLLAEAEEQEARRLTLGALEALLEKVARKMALFDAMADALRRETANVEVRLPALLWPLGLSYKVHCCLALKQQLI